MQGKEVIMGKLGIFAEEEREGVTREDKYRIITASSIAELQRKVNEIVKLGGWDVIGAAFETSIGYCQTMGRLPKEKIARMSIS